MKFVMNGCLIIGTLDGANIEMENEITEKWWPFAFGCSSEEIIQMKRDGTYHSKEIYEVNPKIKRADREGESESAIGA